MVPKTKYEILLHFVGIFVSMCLVVFIFISVNQKLTGIKTKNYPMSNSTNIEQYKCHGKKNVILVFANTKDMLMDLQCVTSINKLLNYRMNLEKKLY